MQTKSIFFEAKDQTSSSLPKLNLPSNHLQSLSLTELTSEMSHILVSLSTDIKLKILKFQTTNLFETLRNSLKTLKADDPDSMYFESNKQQEKEETVLNKDDRYEQKRKMKNFEERYVVFLSEGSLFLNHVTFEEGLLNKPAELLRFLTEDVEDKSRKVLKEILDSPISLQCLLSRLKFVQDYNQIFVLLRQFLRSEVFLSIYHLSNGLIPEQNKKKMDLSSLWRSLSKDCKIRILLQNYKNIQGLAYHLRKQNINLSHKKLTQIIDKYQFSQIDFKINLQNILNPQVQYLKLVYSSLKKEAQLSKRKRHLKVSREERDYNSERKMQKEETYKRKKLKSKKTMSIQSNQTNYTEHQRKLKENKVQKQSLFTRKPHQTIQLSESQKDDRSIRSKKTTKEVQSKYLEERKAPDTLENKESVSSYTTFASSETEDKRVQPLLQMSNSCSATLEKLEEHLSLMSDSISEEANQYFERRIIAYERIQFLLQHYSISIKLFGSCANGIAVKNSDIDIAIDQSILQWLDFVPQNERVVVALQKLQQIFLVYPCFTEIKVIKTAAIPVMKMIINTSMIFISQEYTSFNRSHNSGLIQADITIQTPSKDEHTSHLGLRTTEAISNWISQISCLRTLIIVMKSFFTVSKLNLTYEGGLNTLSMIVMMVAVIKDKKMEEEQNCAIVLQKILEFYVNEFNEKQRGIDLLDSNGEHIFYSKKKYNLDTSTMMKADLEVRDPICQSKNMTRNGYLYPKIKLLFKRILEECFYNPSDVCEQDNIFVSLQLRLIPI